jgi:hypothetical protein
LHASLGQALVRSSASETGGQGVSEHREGAPPNGLSRIRAGPESADLIKGSQLDRPADPSKMAPCQRHAAIEPSQGMEHDRIAKDLLVPSMVPASERSAILDCRATLPVDFGVGGPVIPVPVAELIWSRWVSIPPIDRLVVHQAMMPGPGGCPTTAGKGAYPWADGDSLRRMDARLGMSTQIGPTVII